MAYSLLRDNAREMDHLEHLRGNHEGAIHEENLDRALGFIWEEVDEDEHIADHAELIQFLDYWNERY